ncbi:LysR family transcriptional regulator [Pseudonocardia eucalypti]|uniref:LysR family transcriptional regulator n=1 Tax=Pseudonocardia eucalypti TaxID=648755 RepID=A0ABP9Q2I9_9PSEU|nr:DNA-binding transcriptional LysR family regulator [Pseudonocardia eucalypti]
MHERLGEAEALAALAPRLRQFVAVARAEHLTRAADQIGVPQPTLSRAIARLEAELGITLFLRTGRSLRLTREGRALLQHADRALTELAVAARELAGDTHGMHGRVALGFLTTLGAEVVPRLLRDFHAEHPNIRFDLVQGGHTEVLDRLRDGAADLALTSPVRPEPGIVGQPLGEQELRLTVPAGHRLARHPDGVSTGVPLAEIAEEPFVGFLPGFGLRTTVDDFCRAAGFLPRLAFEGGDVETLRGLVSAGLGVSLLPSSPHPLPAGVVELAVTSPRATRVVGLLWMRGRALSPPVRALREFVQRAGPALLTTDAPR